MKKILAIISAFTLSAGPTAFVVSCSNHEIESSLDAQEGSVPDLANLKMTIASNTTPKDVQKSLANIEVLKGAKFKILSTITDTPDDEDILIFQYTKNNASDILGLVGLSWETWEEQFGNVILIATNPLIPDPLVTGQIIISSKMGAIDMQQS